MSIEDGMVKQTGGRPQIRFIPDFFILLKNLMADSRVPVRSKLVFAGVIVYLIFPIDIIPDVIPLAGQLDDVALVIYGLRYLMRAAGMPLLRENWRGADKSLQILTKLLRI